MDRKENLGNNIPVENMDQIIDHITDIHINTDLPIGVSSIAEMLSTPYYVDKTEYAYLLLTGVSKYIFLSRPRRFGKSLFVSTLEEIAKGNQPLFKDCWIGKSNYVWKKYPVIKLSFSGRSNNTPEQLEAGIKNYLYSIAEQYSISSKLSNPRGSDTVQDYYINLVNKLIMLKGYEPKVVVLIDEYDMPFINVEDTAIKAMNLEVIRNFLTITKNLTSEGKIKLEFVTGISAYCFNECNSGPNNLSDITLKPGYACIVGYKETDLLNIKSAYYQRISDLAAAEDISPDDIIADMRFMYNGYKFSTASATVSVYNPWSTLNFLQDGELDNYWINSGTPTFLIRKVNNRPFFDLELSNPIEATKSELTQPKENNLTVVGEMFQAGYFTIDKYKNELAKASRRTAKDLLLLKFPNKEVAYSFYDLLLKEIGRSAELAGEDHKNEIREALSKVDVDSFIKDIKVCLCSIPYNLFQQEKNNNEAYYHTALHCFLKGAGMHPRSEDPTNQSKTDIIVDSLADTIYICELKHHSTAQKALTQIHDSGYMHKHLRSGKDIVLIGINFSSDGRNITDYLYEVYDTEGNKKSPH